MLEHSRILEFYEVSYIKSLVQAKLFDLLSIVEIIRVLFPLLYPIYFEFLSRKVESITIMPRNYKRKDGAKAYKSSYTNQDLAEAISAVQNGTMKSWKAAKEYGIPKGTLINKLKGLHPREPGPPTIFSVEEEASIVAVVSILGDWNYPLTPFEVRLLAKSVLDKQNCTTRMALLPKLSKTCYLRNVMEMNAPEPARAGVRQKSESK